MESSVQLAGHPGKIVYSNNIIQKEATKEELWAYKNLDELGLRRFVPMLFSTTDKSISIENLLEGTDPATVRVMDLKMGTSTVTKKAKLKGNVEYRNNKDA